MGVLPQHNGVGRIGGRVLHENNWHSERLSLSVCLSVCRSFALSVFLCVCLCLSLSLSGSVWLCLSLSGPIS